MTSKKELFAGPKVRKSNDLPEIFTHQAEPVDMKQEVVFKQQYDTTPMTKEQVEDAVMEAVQKAKEAKDDEECVTAISPELYEMMQEPVEEEWVTKNKRKALLSGLRKMDDKHNRTCGKCMRRLPIDQFRRYQRSEVCEACED